MRRLLAATIFVTGCAPSSSGSGSAPTLTPTPTASPTPTITAPPTPTPSPTPTPVTGCTAGLGPGDHVVPCDGLDFHVRIPGSCPAGGCGLVLDVHGLTMSGDMQDANTQMRARGEANGFVVVQPDANPEPPAAAWAEADFDRVHAFVLDAVAALALDPDRVHVTGFSQGGQMTLAMVCRWPEDFASAAAGAPGGKDCFGVGGSPPAAGIPLLLIHGTNDALIPFSVSEDVRDVAISAWSLAGETVVDSGAGYSRSRVTNASGMVLEFLRHDYASPHGILGGHCYPGSTDPGGAPGQLFSFACSPPNAFNYGADVFDFFLAHPKESS